MRVHRATAIASLLITLSACTSSSVGNERPYQPRFEDTECPPEVKAEVLLELSCGYLSVPQDRDEPDGRTIRVFVARMEPTSGDPATDPMLDLGADIGVGPDIGGFAPMADRIGREVIVMIPRGVGYSSPNLACPEVEEIAGPALRVPSNDPAMHTTFFDRVRTCHARLVGDGTDPSDYGIEEAADDVEDLRIALGIEAWGITTHGTTSRIALEVVRRYPEHLREVVLDSPDWPQIDPFRQSIEGTRHAFEQLSRACADDARCAERSSNLGATIERAIDRFDREPRIVQLSSGAEMLLDGAMFLRLLRYQLTTPNTTDILGRLPRAIERIAAGELEAPAGSVLAAAGGGQAYCPGYLPTCLPSVGLFQGAYFSSLCGDIVPFVEPREPERLAQGDPAYVTAFVESPYRELCSAWKVETADPSIARPLTADVPTLILLGALDPLSTLPYAEEGAQGLDTHYIVVADGHGHGVTGINTCIQEIRNAWVEDPTRPPEQTVCPG